MAQILAQESELLLFPYLNTENVFIFQCQQAVWPQPSPEDITIHCDTGGPESNNLIWFIWHIFTFNFSYALCRLSFSWPAAWFIFVLAEMHVGLRSENFYYSNFHMWTDEQITVHKTLKHEWLNRLLINAFHLEILNSPSRVAIFHAKTITLKNCADICAFIQFTHRQTEWQSVNI